MHKLEKNPHNNKNEQVATYDLKLFTWGWTMEV